MWLIPSGTVRPDESPRCATGLSTLISRGCRPACAAACGAAAKLLALPSQAQVKLEAKLVMLSSILRREFCCTCKQMCESCHGPSKEQPELPTRSCHKLICTCTARSSAIRHSRRSLHSALRRAASRRARSKFALGACRHSTLQVGFPSILKNLCLLTARSRCRSYTCTAQVADALSQARLVAGSAQPCPLAANAVLYLLQSPTMASPWTEVRCCRTAPAHPVVPEYE